MAAVTRERARAYLAEIMEISKKHGLMLVDDCCCCGGSAVFEIGGDYKNKLNVEVCAGLFSDGVCFLTRDEDGEESVIVE